MNVRFLEVKKNIPMQRLEQRILAKMVLRMLSNWLVYQNSINSLWG